MKKWFVVILLASMMLSVTACGKTKGEKESVETGSMETESESVKKPARKPSQETENIKKSSGIGKNLQSGREGKEKESEDPFYILCLPYAEDELNEYGTEFIGDGIYVENRYNAYSGVSTRFGRFSKTEDEREALEIVAERMEISADDIRYEKTTCCGYPALSLEYTCGSNEDTTSCFDRLIFGEDALHWFGTSCSADWLEDNRFGMENNLEELYLQEVTEEMLLAKSEGDIGYLICDVKYGGEDAILMNDLQHISGDDVELMETYEINPDEVGYDNIYVELGDSEYYEYPLYDKGTFSLLEYDEEGYANQVTLSAQEFVEKLKESADYPEGYLCDVTLIGDVPVIIRERELY